MSFEKLALLEKQLAASVSSTKTPHVDTTPNKNNCGINLSPRTVSDDEVSLLQKELILLRHLRTSQPLRLSLRLNLLHAYSMHNKPTLLGDASIISLTKPNITKDI